MRRRSVLAFLLAAILCVRPVLGQAPTVANPDLFAKSVKAATEVTAHYGASEDAAALARVNRVAYELAQHSEYTKSPFTFGLVDMAAPNAFALPGGQIFITRGMLDLGLDDDMLAAILGHEIAHVTLDHFQRMQRKATWMNVLSTVLMVGVMVGAGSDNQRTPDGVPYDPRVGVDRGGDVVQGAAALSLIVSELLLRSYSREHEDEADKEGQRLAAAAGYDPDGARRVWEKLSSRAPQLKQYGYWQTHPFADERMRSAGARKGTWKVQGEKSADDFRLRTQAALTSYLDRNKVEDDVATFLKAAALATWPKGKVAEGFRLEKLHQLRDAEVAKPDLSRDYGTVLRSYREELAAVRSNDPASELPATLESEIADLEAKVKEAFPKAVEVLAGGIFETSFLVSFLSNYPEATQVPDVALSLGDAYSRLGNATEATARYLAAWQAGPETPAGKRALGGLRNLAPSMKELAALQQLADQDDDAELKRVAAERLAGMAKTYSDVSNGADYLRRFPDGAHVATVVGRLNVLADNLYGEIVLYQSMGDSVRAIERINKILTHAPLSPAAEKLRDSAVLTAHVGRQ